MRDRSLQRVKLVQSIALVIAAATMAGCGSDSSTNPNGPVGKYPLTGTATISDVDEVGDHAGIRLAVLQSGTTVTSTTTAADGSFTLSALADGDYTLRARRDFYSTINRQLRVRDSLLVEPIGQMNLQKTFSVAVHTDSLSYTHESDSVHVWMTLKNDNFERLDLYNRFVIPYDFVVFDPSENDREVWRWGNHRPHINDDRYDFIETIAATDSLLIHPIGDVAAWGKVDETGRLMPEGKYEIEASIELIDDRDSLRTFIPPRREVKLIP